MTPLSIATTSRAARSRTTMRLLPLKIALRYLVSKKSHTAVSVISAVAVCAVAVTAMAMICVLSVFNGFHQLVDSKMSSLEPDVKVSAKRGVIGDAAALIDKVMKVDGVEIAVPTVTESALVIYGNRQIPIVLKGITADYDSLTNLKQLIKPDGKFLLSAGSDDYCIMSIGAALTLDARPGFEPVCYVYAPRRVGAVNVANPATAFQRVPTFVSGVFEVRQGAYDQNYVFTSLRAARTLLDYTTEATAVEVRLRGGADEAAVMESISKTVGDGYKVENRLMQHSQSLKMINVEKWISLLLLSMILIVASFNVISTLAILILEKKENIRTLHSLGADNRMVRWIFVAEGWLVSVVGAVVGLSVGVALCLLQQRFGFIRLSADTSNLVVSTYPVAVSAVDVAMIFGIVALVGLLASFATTRAMRGYLRKL